MDKILQRGLGSDWVDFCANYSRCVQRVIKLLGPAAHGVVGLNSASEPLLPVLAPPHPTHNHLTPRPRTPTSSEPPTQPSSPSRGLKHSSRAQRKPYFLSEPHHPSTISTTASTASIPSTSTSTSTSTYTTHLEVDRALTEATRRIRKTSPEKPYSRPHIYADSVRTLPLTRLHNILTSLQHKAKVRIQTQKDREEMEKELYNIKRSAGEIDFL